MKTLRPKEREADILKTIMDGLAAMHVFHIRMNSGAMFGTHKGKRWAVRFGSRGMADILVILHHMEGDFIVRHFWKPIWIETKAPGKKQSGDQMVFQAEVEAEGHRYICVSSWEQVLEVLK